jgi:hypothetical protein
MKNLFIIVIILATLTSCRDTAYDTFQGMTSPIILVAESEDGDVVLVDAQDKRILINRDYYAAQAVSNTYDVGDTLHYVKNIKFYPKSK